MLFCFDGIDDSISIPQMNYDEITVSVWFNRYSKDSVNADAILGGWRWNADTQLQEGYDVRFFNYPDNINFILVTENNLGIKSMQNCFYDLGDAHLNKWYHLVATGQHVASMAHPAGNIIVPMTFYSDMRIGHSRVNNGYFNGVIDDIRIYNRPLTSNEISCLYMVYGD